MKCRQCNTEASTGELRCLNCGSAVSYLTPGDLAPRLPQVRVTELLSNAPPALLWLAEKGSSRERLFIAEYEPKVGGKAVLRDFNLWFQNLKALPANIIPVLDTRYTHEERSYLVFEAPGVQSVRRVLEGGQNAIPPSQFLRELLHLLDQFTQSLPGSSHGWIRAETVMIFPDGRLLLGPPSFAPWAVVNPQSDLKDCATIAAQWAEISLRQSDTDTKQYKQLQKFDDWALASTLEWMLLCKDRVPQSASAVATFLREASAVRNGELGKDGSAALNTLKRLYQRSGSVIVKREIENTEERIAKTPAATQTQPQPRQDTEPAPDAGPDAPASPPVHGASMSGPSGAIVSAPAGWTSLARPSVLALIVVGLLVLVGLAVFHPAKNPGTADITQQPVSTPPQPVPQERPRPPASTGAAITYATYAGMRFEVIKNGDGNRRYLLIHGNEGTARKALRDHLQNHSGTGYLVSGNDRLFEYDGAKLDPNRLFSREGAEKNLRRLNAASMWPRFPSLLDKLDRERGDLVSVLTPPSGALLVAPHNTSMHTIRDEIPLSDQVSMKDASDAYSFMLCTSESDYAILARSPYNVVLQLRAPKDDDGSLSRLAARVGIRYVNIESPLGQIQKQMKMIGWVNDNLP